MRPQQNRRMRGRGNNNNSNNNGNGGGGNNQNQNRKGPNPLTRSYESNGPDVKIRGSAQQIAEKYTTLARDAHTSGDRVMAENYLQHAEHYNRLIMAAQAQMPQHQQVQQRDDDDMDDDDDGFGNSNGNGNDQPMQHQQPQQNQQPQQHQPRNNGSGPQPVIEGTPAEVALRQGSIGQAPVVQASVSGQQAVGGEQPQDGAQASGDGEGDAPRRPRRPRRPRSRGGDQAAASGTEEAGEGSDEPVTEAAQ